MVRNGWVSKYNPNQKEMSWKKSINLPRAAALAAAALEANLEDESSTSSSSCWVALDLSNEKKPWLFAVNKGLYYPIIWGLYIINHEIRIPCLINQDSMENPGYLPTSIGTIIRRSKDPVIIKPTRIQWFMFSTTGRDGWETPTKNQPNQA